jgi:hypothetical protein
MKKMKKKKKNGRKQNPSFETRATKKEKLPKFYAF